MEVKKPNKSLLFYAFVVMIVLILLNALVIPRISERSVTETTYDEFLALLDAKYVKQVEIDNSSQVIYYEAAKDGVTRVCKTGLMNDPDLVGRLQAAGTKFGNVIPTTQSPLITFLVGWILPIAIFVVLGQWLSKRMMKSMGGPGAMSFGKSNAKIYVKSSTGIKYSDVAGEDEAKELLQEIVDFLHNPQKYREIGAQMPKGALLVGPPGTGKTLLAKAVAGEAEVPFFSISGSEFVEMFVGMGAAKVRDLFKQAQEKAPCIVFIDEIDTIGKKRDGQIGGNDERE